MMKTQRQELEDAVSEGRQPNCVGCGNPLDTVSQKQSDYLYWEWSEKEKQYVKDDEGGDSDLPHHESCGYEDWDLIDSCKAAREIGLDY